MTKLSYTITTVNGITYTANTYAEAMRIMSENRGARKTAHYEPIAEPTATAPKQYANRRKAF